MVDQITCIVCRRQRNRTESEVLVLTDLEKTHLQKLGHEVVNEVAYCRPCYRLMTDQQSAVDLMTGMYSMRLRAMGVPNANKISEEFKKGLLAKSKRSS